MKAKCGDVPELNSGLMDEGDKRSKSRIKKIDKDESEVGEYSG